MDFYYVAFYYAFEVRVIHIMFPVKQVQNNPVLTFSLLFLGERTMKKIREELEKAVHIIWNCRLSSLKDSW